MSEAISGIAQQLVVAYQAEHESLLVELQNSQDESAREDLLVAKSALETVVLELSRIQDVTTAHQASESLAKAIRGMQPAVRFQIIDHARTAIADEILGPVRAPIDPHTARESAIAFLRQEIDSTARQAMLADISREGLNGWASRNHMPFGMGVRNRLREAGYAESVFGVNSLDDVWAELVYLALTT